MLYEVYILEAPSLQPINYSIQYTVSLYNIVQGRVYLRFNILTKLELHSTYTVHSRFYIGWIVLACPYYRPRCHIGLQYHDGGRQAVLAYTTHYHEVRTGSNFYVI